MHDNLIENQGKISFSGVDPETTNNLLDSGLTVELGAHWIHSLRNVQTHNTHTANSNVMREAQFNEIAQLAKQNNIELYETSCDDEPGDDCKLFDVASKTWLSKAQFDEAMHRVNIAKEKMEENYHDRIRRARNLNNYPGDDVPLGVELELAWQETTSHHKDGSNNHFWCKMMAKRQVSQQSTPLNEDLFKRVFNWSCDRIAIACAYPLDMLGTRVWEDGEADGEGGEALLSSASYLQLITYPVKDHDLDVRLNEKVKQVQLFPKNSISAISNVPEHGLTSASYIDAPVLISTDTTDYFCNHALITLPIGVLQANSVNFDPPLPPRNVSAINRLHSGLLNIVVLKFPYKFWDEGHKDINFFGSTRRDDEETTFPLWLNLSQSRKNQANMPAMLMAQVVPPFASAIETMTEQQVSELALYNLRQLFHDRMVPNPTGCITSKWYAEQFSFVSYCIW
jgi:hypothetical protein